MAVIIDTIQLDNILWWQNFFQKYINYAISMLYKFFNFLINAVFYKKKKFIFN